MDTMIKSGQKFRRIKDKIRTFVQSALGNKRDLNIGGHTSEHDEEAYKKAHENLKMY